MTDQRRITRSWTLFRPIRLNTIEFSVWTDEINQAFVYEYTQAREHEDIARYCKDLSFRVGYLPPSGSQGRGTSVDFKGMSSLPPVEIHLTFYRGDEQQGFYWTETSWHSGVFSSWKYRTDKWSFKPETIGLKLRFKDSGYTHDAGYVTVD